MKKNFIYNIEKKEDIINFDGYSFPYDRNARNFHKFFTINIGKLNPLNFNKINILYDDIDNVYTKISWGDDPYGGTDIINFLKNKNIREIIINAKVNDNESEVYKYLLHNLKYVEPSGLVAWIKIGLTFYWENNNYYLQLLIHKHAEIWWPHTDGGGLWLGIGKGIKLYN